MKHDTTETELQLLADFLNRFGVPAEGHGRKALAPAEEELLGRLARGELGVDERSKLIPLLAHNEVAMEFLASCAGT